MREWKYRILRTFGNEIGQFRITTITTRWLRAPILERSLVALIKRMLHFNKGTLDYTLPEMEKRADSADISVLFFLIAVLIFWL